MFVQFGKFKATSRRKFAVFVEQRKNWMIISITLFKRESGSGKRQYLTPWSRTITER